MNAAEAGFAALQPIGGTGWPVLVHIRCSTSACGRELDAWVVATEAGPVFWSVLSSMTPERYDAETEELRRARQGSWPGEVELVARNRAIILAEGGKVGPMAPELRRNPLRRDVFDLLAAEGEHPLLEVRCRKHGPGEVDRAKVIDALRRPGNGPVVVGSTARR